MAEPRFNPELLLEPIPGDSPTGLEISRGDAESTLYRLKSARDAAYAAEDRRFRARIANDPQNPESALPKPDWDSVLRDAVSVIAAQSKDFRAAAWLTESALRVEGFGGLRRGLEVCRGLGDKFWDQMHPAPTETDGHSLAVGPFAGLCGEAARRQLRLLPINSQGGITLDHYLRANRTAPPSEGGGTTSSLEYSAAEILSEARDSGPAFYATLQADLESSFESLQSLARTFQERCRPDEYGESPVPSTTGLATDLEEALLVVRALKAEIGGADEGGASASSEAGDAPPAGESPTRSPAQGTVSNRQDALRTLLKVADFFEKSEPHSPVSYALRQVVKWGDMKLPELLAELISDSAVRADLTRRVGVPLHDKES